MPAITLPAQPIRGHGTGRSRRSYESLHGLHPNRRVDDALPIHHTAMADKQSVIHPTRLIPLRIASGLPNAVGLFPTLEPNRPY